MKREYKERAILRAIRQAAKKNRPCPSNAELAELIGSRSPGSASHILQHLEQRGEFTVARHGWARTVFFDDGLHTAVPEFRTDVQPRERAAPPAPAAIVRSGEGAPCSACGCKPSSCTCPTFHPTQLPSCAAGGIVSVGARG